MGEILQKPVAIYSIRCKNTARIYIGMTQQNVGIRVRQHFLALKNREKESTTGGKVWQEDFDKYGIESFEVYIIERNIQPEEAKSRENHYMKMYDSINPEKGYNSKLNPLGENTPFCIPFFEGLPPTNADSASNSTAEIRRPIDIKILREGGQEKLVERTDFGKEVMKRLVEIGRSQKWLIEEINERLGTKIDSAYFCHILSGKRGSKRIESEIRKILVMQEDDT